MHVNEIHALNKGQSKACCDTEEKIYIPGLIREGFMKEETLMKLRLFMVYLVRNESEGNLR